MQAQQMQGASFHHGGWSVTRWLAVCSVRATGSAGAIFIMKHLQCHSYEPFVFCCLEMQLIVNQRSFWILQLNFLTKTKPLEWINPKSWFPVRYIIDLFKALKTTLKITMYFQVIYPAGFNTPPREMKNMQFHVTTLVFLPQEITAESGAAWLWCRNVNI